jgi:hypothetical protein
MAATIQFSDPTEHKKAIRIFQQYGDTVPTGVANTYHVRDRILEKLEHKHLRFEQISYWLTVTEEMFDQLQESLKETERDPTSYLTDIDELFD